ncbi:MAG: protein translocase subunit SecD [Thermoguttaceae bacterium]
MLRFLMTLVSPNGRGPARTCSPPVSRRGATLVGLMLVGLLALSTTAGPATLQAADEPSATASADPAVGPAAPAPAAVAKSEPAAESAAKPAEEPGEPKPAEPGPQAAAPESVTDAAPEPPAAETPTGQPAPGAAGEPSPVAKQVGSTTTTEVATEPSAYWGSFVLFLVVVVGSIVLAAFVSSSLRLREYQTALTIIFLSLSAGVAVIYAGWPPKLGIDLKGGVYLVYATGERAKESLADAAPDRQQDPNQRGSSLTNDEMNKLVSAISRRINPGGVKEVVIRPFGKDQIEIVIPEVDENEIERYKEKITSAGTLEFRILANRRDPRHAAVIEAAEKSPDEKFLYMRDVDGNPVRDETGTLKILGWWVPLSADSDVARFASSEIPLRQRQMGERTITEVLVVNDMYNVTGGYLVRSSPGIDEQGRPNVNFMFNAKGGQLFAGLTGENLPDEGHNLQRQLGIILDGYMFSAPSIRSQIHNNGEITGDFTDEQVRDLVDVLNAGMLPTTLQKEPISQLATGPTLGSDTIRSSSIAMLASLVMVLVFMTAYYRVAGAIACAVLLANVLLTVAVMIFIKAAFTLPGMAGLVLSLGLSIDANVLINERIREELERQATLRMAIRNGFARAMSAIVDSNVTTIFTGIVLYVIGTDQIKGFAVTLCLGITLSMFTACYCAQIIFQIAERKRWITTVKMAKIPLTRTIDFVGMQVPAIAVSAIVILVGLVAVFARGSGLLDIDFTGGVSVQMVFNEEQDISEIREKLGQREDVFEDLTVQDLTLPNEPPHRRFVINTARGDVDKNAEAFLDEVKTTLQEIFGDKLVHHTMQITGQPGDAPADQPKTGAVRTDLPGDDLLAAADEPVLPAPGTKPEAGDGQDPAPAAEQKSDAAKPAPAAETKPDSQQPAAPAESEKKPEAAAKTDQPAVPAEAPEGPPASKTEPSPKAPAPVVTSTFDVTFGADKMTYATLQEGIQKQMTTLGTAASFELTNPQYAEDYDPDRGHNAWKVTVNLPADQARKVLEAVKASVESMAVFPSSNTIGGQVAADTQWKAIAAVLASLVIIVIYIWIRFERITFGLAATIALIHDVLVTLGAIALTAWLAPYFGFMLIEEFKIGLSVVAAFLTLMGYSLEDTIVIFDRLREIRGKTPYLTVEMFNQAINQTLSRTMITAFLVLMSVIILYFFGGAAIRVFAFAMVIGAIAGTYSTIFIASPIVLWIDRSAQAKSRKA